MLSNLTVILNISDNLMLLNLLYGIMLSAEKLFQTINIIINDIFPIKGRKTC